MNINIFHVYSNAQNRDKAFDTVLKTTHQRVSVWRRNIILG